MGSWSGDCIREADCTDHPTLVIQHMKEAAAWLRARRCWRATTLGWSIHKENRYEDRASAAKKGTFHFVQMGELVSLMEFSPRTTLSLLLGHCGAGGGGYTHRGFFQCLVRRSPLSTLCRTLCGLLDQASRTVPTGTHCFLRSHFESMLPGVPGLGVGQRHGHAWVMSRYEVSQGGRGGGGGIPRWGAGGGRGQLAASCVHVQ